MAHSSSLIADLKTAYNTGPAVASVAKAIDAGGPIQDIRGNLNAVLRMLEEAQTLAGLTIGPIKEGLLQVTDAGDGSLATLNGVIAALAGTSQPSTSLIADMATVISNGPAAATKAAAIAPGGEIMDYVGNCNLVLGKLTEASVLLGLTIGNIKTGILAVLDNGDGITAGVTGVKNALVGTA